MTRKCFTWNQEQQASGFSAIKELFEVISTVDKSIETVEDFRRFSLQY